MPEAVSMEVGAVFGFFVLAGGCVTMEHGADVFGEEQMAEVLPVANGCNFGETRPRELDRDAAVDRRGHEQINVVMGDDTG